MHEGKHGILDDLEDMDDLFGKPDKKKDKDGHGDDCGCGHDHGKDADKK